MGEITEQIGRGGAGDALAAERLFAMLYDELRHLAAAQLRGDDAVRSCMKRISNWPPTTRGSLKHDSGRFRSNIPLELIRR